MLYAHPLHRSERARERARKRESAKERERERERERGRERERERNRVRKRERELFLKGMTGALAPFSYAKGTISPVKNSREAYKSVALSRD